MRKPGQRFKLSPQKAGLPKKNLPKPTAGWGWSTTSMASLMPPPRVPRTLTPLPLRDFDWPYYLGRLYQDEGDNKKAVDYLTMAQGLRPNDIAALVNLAEVYHADGQLEPAKALFEKALALDPSLADAEAGLGEIALSQGDYAVAIRDLEAAIKLQPEATSLHYPLAMAYRKSGDVTDALVHLKEKGSVKPKVPDPLMDALYDLKRGQVPCGERETRRSTKGGTPTRSSTINKCSPPLRKEIHCPRLPGNSSGIRG